jgi:hypothetical protein
VLVFAPCQVPGLVWAPINQRRKTGLGLGGTYGQPECGDRKAPDSSAPAMIRVRVCGVFIAPLLLLSSRRLAPTTYEILAFALIGETWQESAQGR